MNNKFVIGGVVVALAIVGLVIGFSGGPSPDDIVAQMLDKMSEVKSTSLELAMTIQSDADESSGVVNFNIAVDSNDVDNVKFKFGGNARFQVSGSTFGLAFESLVLDKKIYLKANIPSLPIPIDISALNNRWIVIDIPAAQQQFGSNYSTELTTEQEEQLRQALRQSLYIKTTQVLSDEVINGVDSYHYQYVVDEEALGEYVVRVMEITQSRPLDASDASQVATFKADLKESFKGVEPMTGEIWIGKSDLLLYKLTLSVTDAGDSITDSSVNLDAVLTFKNYGRPLSLTAPASYITIEEAMGLLSQSADR